MSNFYNPSTGFPNEPRQRQSATSGASSGGDGFYSQGGYGAQQQQQPSGGVSSSGYAGYAGGGGGYGAGGGSNGAASTMGGGGGYGMGSGSQPMQQQQQQQQQGQQSQQQPAAPAFWNPAAAATVMSAAASGKGLSNDAMFGVAESMGQQFLQAGTARMVPGLESAMVTLRVYFAVDNQYVKRKMLKVLFPFAFKQWGRMELERSGPDLTPQYALPRSDDNAPDLYLPWMSLVTYVLLCALCYGNAGKFDPEVLPDVLTKCFVTQILEVLAMRFGLYLMQTPIAFLDLFSVTGYKYLGLCINMLAGLVLGHFGHGHRGYYITFLWTALAVSYFVLKTMANNIPRETAASGPKRELMVLGFAGSQFATCWFVSQTKFLN